MRVVPIKLRAANEVVASLHRHNCRVRGHLFSTAVVDDDGQIRGVAIVGRPCRQLDDGVTAEITRVATDGYPNACSKLYATARRVAFILGYRKVTTLNLKGESGASLRAAGFVCTNENAGGGTWSRKTRPRVDKHPLERKRRWEATA